MTGGGPAARVLIVGGGPAGAAVALSLTRAGFTPVVLEAQPGPQPKVGECLPPSANPLLADLGLAEAVGCVGLPSHGNRFVWGSAEPLERDFLFGTAGVGWQLDRRRFEEELAEAAIRAGADWRYGHRVVRCSRGERGRHTVEVKTEGGLRVHQADFVVDASGRAGQVGRLLAGHRVRYDRLVGVVAYIGSAHGTNAPAAGSSTLVEAVAQGWWYSAALPGGKLAAAYLTDADLLGHAPQLEKDWRALLEEAPHTRQRVRQGGDAPSAAPRILSAQTSRAAAVVGAGWLAVGDAAVAHDPLTSYGITAALGSGLHAGAAVGDYLGGRREALLDYARLVDRAFAHYLILHHDRYLGERRWPDSTFWQRRHARATTTAQAG